MSVQTVLDFWQRVHQETQLQEKLRAIPSSEPEATVAAVVRLAGEAGFDFTTEDYELAVRDELNRRHAAGELSEEQLAALAGGLGYSAQSACFCQPAFNKFASGGGASADCPAR